MSIQWLVWFLFIIFCVKQLAITQEWILIKIFLFVWLELYFELNTFVLVRYIKIHNVIFILLHNLGLLQGLTFQNFNAIIYTFRQITESFFVKIEFNDGKADQCQHWIVVLYTLFFVFLPKKLSTLQVNQTLIVSSMLAILCWKSIFQSRIKKISS